jgi:hypothetical protein
VADLTLLPVLRLSPSEERQIQSHTRIIELLVSRFRCLQKRELQRDTSVGTGTLAGADSLTAYASYFDRT